MLCPLVSVEQRVDGWVPLGEDPDSVLLRLQMYDRASLMDKDPNINGLHNQLESEANRLLAKQRRGEPVASDLGDMTDSVVCFESPDPDSTDDVDLTQRRLQLCITNVGMAPAFSPILVYLLLEAYDRAGEVVDELWNRTEDGEEIPMTVHLAAHDQLIRVALVANATIKITGACLCRLLFLPLVALRGLAH